MSAYNKRISKKLYNIAANTEISDYDAREILDEALRYEYVDGEAPLEFKEKNLKRIMVNSIRHNYSNYDDGLKQVHRLKASETVYFRYKNMVLNQISLQYPYLSDECKRQKHTINMVKIIR